MEYNFELIAGDLSMKMDKRIVAMHKTCKKEMNTIFNFVSAKLPLEKRQLLEQEIADVLSDDFKRNSAIFIETLNKVNRVLAVHLK